MYTPVLSLKLENNARGYGMRFYILTVSSLVLRCYDFTRLVSQKYIG